MYFFPSFFFFQNAVSYARFLTTGTKHVSCYGGSDGRLAADIFSGMQSWFISTSGREYGPTSSSVTTLPAGNYFVKTSVQYGTNFFTTAGTCYATSTATTEVRQPPAPLTVTVSIVPASCSWCYNGNVTVTVSGGWATNGGIYRITTSSASLGTSSCQSTGTYPCAVPSVSYNRNQGDYNVTVTDCFGTSLVSSYCYSPPQTCVVTKTYTVGWAEITTPAPTTVRSSQQLL